MFAMEPDMKRDLQQIDKKVEEVDIKVSGILAFLRGNELDKEDHGMVGRLNDIERRVEFLEKWKDRIIWGLVGMGLPAGVGIWELLKTVITHKP